MTLEEARASGLPISTGAVAGADDRPERPERLTDVATPTPAADPPPDPIRERAAEKAAATQPQSPPMPTPPAPVEVPLVDRIKEARELLEGCGCTVLDHAPEPVVIPVVVPGAPSPEQVLASALPAAPTQTFGWHLGQTLSLSGNATACAYRTAMDVVRGVRTFLFFGVTGVIALADATGAIDVTPLMERFLPESVTGLTTAQLTLLMSVAGLWLRMVTKTPTFGRWRSSARGGSGVDSPEEETRHG